MALERIEGEAPRIARALVQGMPWTDLISIYMSRYVFRPKTRVSAKPSKLPKFVHIEGGCRSTICGHTRAGDFAPWPTLQALDQFLASSPPSRYRRLGPVPRMGGGTPVRAISPRDPLFRR